MSNANGKERLLRLIENAFDGDQAPDSPHVVDDEELLARWSVGAIDPSEREVIIVHLDRCRECRDIVGLMVENGALVLPEATVPRGIREPVAEHVPVTVPRTERESPPTTPTAREAIAQPRLTAGGQTSSAKYVKLGALAVAASLLGALFILWPRETRLGQSLALTEFDFELDGNSYAMPVHVLAEDTKQRWQAKISRQPRDVRLRIEYGHLFLKHNYADEAIAQFDKALTLEPGNADAHIGKGVALYEKAYSENSDDLEAALEQFRLALSSRPNDFSGQLNTAICLDRLGRPDQAIDHWKRAYELVPNDNFRQDIRDHLRQRAVELR